MTILLVVCIILISLPSCAGFYAFPRLLLRRDEKPMTASKLKLFTSTTQRAHVLFAKKANLEDDLVTTTITAHMSDEEEANLLCTQNLHKKQEVWFTDLGSPPSSSFQIFSKNNSNIQSFNNDETMSTTSTLQKIPKHPLLCNFKVGPKLQIVFSEQLTKKLAKLPKTLTTCGIIEEEGDFDFMSVENKLGSATKPNVSALLSLATSSKFGNGTETVYDETVRKGKEITANQLTINLQSYFERQILKKIKDALFPKASSVRMQFYKLAMYEEGGHFDYHRDTAHAANHQATLLVEVKSSHEGGRLMFEHEGYEWEGIDFSTPHEACRYIAFYTDIKHKVEPVTKGCRMVLQYDIYVEDKHDEEENDEVENDVEPFDEEPYLEANTCSQQGGEDDIEYDRSSETIRILSKDIPQIINELANCFHEHVVDDGEIVNIAIPFFHRYHAQYILPKYLKSIDAQLFQAILETGLYEIGLCPLQMRAEVDIDDGMQDRDYWAHRCQSMGEVYTWDKRRNIWNSKEVTKEDSINTGETIYIPSRAEKAITLQYNSFIEFTGNEAQPAEYFYFLGAMFIRRKEQEGG